MELIRCENGHYYNREKFPSCPQCAHIPTFQAPQTGQKDIETLLPNENAVRQINDSLRKTVGWLVCTQGNMIGESFPIRQGDNRIGRSTTMDIILIYENSVSRENHANIRYDSEKREFSLILENSEHPVAINDKKITESAILTNRDRIALGKCVLTFVPFCDNNFDWND